MRVMNPRNLAVSLLLSVSAAGFAASTGAWLQKVPAAERAHANPYAGQPDAAAAGRNLYTENCAKCHGANAEGKGHRPALASDRLRAATDGEIAWLIKNGEPFKGMPGWGSLPEQERWQIVAYLRSLNQQTLHTSEANQ